MVKKKRRQIKKLWAALAGGEAAQPFFGGESVKVSGPFKEGTFLRFQLEEAEPQDVLEFAYFGLVSRVSEKDFLFFLPFENISLLRKSKSSAAKALLSLLPAEYVSLPDELKRKLQDAIKVLSFARYVVEKALEEDTVLVLAPAGEGVVKFLADHGVEHKAGKDGVALDARKLLEALNLGEVV